MQGTGASTSQVSYIGLVALLRRIESYAIRRNRGLVTRGLIRKMLFFLGSIDFCVLCFFRKKGYLICYNVGEEYWAKSIKFLVCFFSIATVSKEAESLCFLPKNQNHLHSSKIFFFDMNNYTCINCREEASNSWPNLL